MEIQNEKERLEVEMSRHVFRLMSAEKLLRMYKRQGEGKWIDAINILTRQINESSQDVIETAKKLYGGGVY